MHSVPALPLLLKQLGLPTMFDSWEVEEQNALKNKWTHSEYLSVLSDKEATNRQQKRVERHIREAKLIPGKTLDSFDFDAAKSINAAQIKALAENTSWVKQAENLIIFGPSGVGKTHLACAIGYRHIEQCTRVLFTQATSLVQKLHQARTEYRLSEALAKLARIPLLILDDIGYVKHNEAETSVLFELIAERYETNSLIITSNLAFGEWDKIFPDNMMAVAAIDRLVHHTTIMNIEAQSFRRTHAKTDK